MPNNDDNDNRYLVHTHNELRQRRRHRPWNVLFSKKYPIPTDIPRPTTIPRSSFVTRLCQNRHTLAVGGVVTLILILLRLWSDSFRTMDGRRDTLDHVVVLTRIDQLPQTPSFGDTQRRITTTNNQRSNIHTLSVFCTTWQVHVDEWWTNRLDWILVHQNRTHQCFQRIVASRKEESFLFAYGSFGSSRNRLPTQHVQLLQDLHRIQNPKRPTTFLRQDMDCHQHPATNAQSLAVPPTFYKYISKSGWGVDMSHVMDGLMYALDHQVRVEFVFARSSFTNNNKNGNGKNQESKGWPYAAGVCPSEDLSCYFLPIGTPDESEKDLHCHPRNATHPEDASDPTIRYYYQWKGGFHSHPDHTKLWLLQTVTRGQQWLRYRAVQLAHATIVQGQQRQNSVTKSQSSTSDEDDLVRNWHCDAAIHVRRGDVILHGKFSRKYHPIQEYLETYEKDVLSRGYSWLRQKTKQRNVLLLTDDANAVKEALSEFSPKATKRGDIEYHWYFVERPRHSGPSGGWENPFPSTDAVYEVVVLHAEFLLAQHCDTFVHTKSNLADYIYAMMLLPSANVDSVRHLDLDATQNHKDIHASANTQTISVSTKYEGLE